MDLADRDVVAASPSSTYPVLKAAGDRSDSRHAKAEDPLEIECVFSKNEVWRLPLCGHFLAAKQGKLDVKSLPHKYRQFEIPAVNVNRDIVNQVVHDYIESTPKYDLANFFAQWSVALP